MDRSIRSDPINGSIDAMRSNPIDPMRSNQWIDRYDPINGLLDVIRCDLMRYDPINGSLDAIQSDAIRSDRSIDRVGVN
jgi:hypothetical protein